MKVLQTSVDWYPGYANSPQLKVLVDKAPDHSLLRYEKRGGLYFAHLDGYVSFFYYDKPGDGYAGRVFDITLLDGTQVSLKGPWSSRAGCVNNAGFEPCLNVSLTDDPTVWTRGYTFFAAAVTLKAVLPALPDGIVLVEEHHNEDITYSPAKWSQGGEL